MTSAGPQTQEDIRTRFRFEDLRTFRNSAGIPYAVVGHNKSEKLITDHWAGGFDTEQDFRQVLEFICACFETGDYSYWLADLRYLNTSFAHSEDWLANTVFPRCKAAGLIREAVVLPHSEGAPPDYDVQGTGSSALSKIISGRIQGFYDLDEANSWLFASG